MAGPYETDKVPSGLLAVYEQLWASRRGQQVRLLEIGVARGGSMRFWADFFHPDSVLVGLDLELPAGEFPSNVRLVRGDQNDRAALLNLAEEFGPFDMVLDDGSHFTKETRHCFETLWPHVAVDGWYVIEDWAVGYWRDQDPRYRGMVEVVTEIVRDAPERQIAEFTVSLKRGQTYAAFRKGAEGWQY
jgi:23S rRNA U2552 (ribose-2'-O)-methylase RlmE/FtsJ